MTDPIADFITRIFNGYQARKTEVVIPHSKVKESIAHLLEREKYLDGVEVSDDKGRKSIKVMLRYVNKQPAITGVKRLSRPGLRRYSRANGIPRSLGGYGLTVVSTSSGVFSDKEAKGKHIGGELLCSVW